MTEGKLSGSGDVAQSHLLWWGGERGEEMRSGSGNRPSFKLGRAVLRKTGDSSCTHTLRSKKAQRVEAGRLLCILAQPKVGLGLSESYYAPN